MSRSRLLMAGSHLMTRTNGRLLFVCCCLGVAAGAVISSSRHADDDPEISRAELSPEDEKLLDDLDEKMQSLQRLPVRGRLHLRGHNYVTTEISRDELIQLVKSLEERPFDDAITLLQQRLPELKELAAIEYVFDGLRYRSITRFHSDPGEPEDLFDSTFNGNEQIYYQSGDGSQVDVFDRGGSMVQILQLEEFWKRPVYPFITGRHIRPASLQSSVSKIEVRRVATGREILIESKSGNQFVIDAANGFLRQESFRMPVSDYWQLFPTTLANGLVYPRLSIDSKSNRMQVYLIDQVELMDRLPTDAFAVAVPAGTTVVSYRGIPREEHHLHHRPRVTRLSAHVPDIAAHVSEWSAPRVPKLKVGAMAPPLNPPFWVNQQGRANAPSLEGKVVLIDFWGISCGPCQAELAEVSAAAKQFAMTDLVILGMHDSSTDVETLVAFAKEKDLTYLLAIDAPSPENFGKSFVAYDIWGIPSAVVINRQGQVAFKGCFLEALEFAHQLLKRDR